jgi:hypothetical protein
MAGGKTDIVTWIKSLSEGDLSDKDILAVNSFAVRGRVPDAMPGGSLILWPKGAVLPEGYVDTGDELNGYKVIQKEGDIEFEYPVPGNNGATQTTVTSTTLQLDWTKATDPNDDPSLLEYHVYYSETDNISTVADAEANGILAHSATDINTYTIIGLAPSAGYFVNVIVENTAGLKAAYEMTADFTLEDDEVEGLTINEGDFTLTQNTNSSVNSEEFLITWDTEVIGDPDDTATPVSSNTDVATVQKVSDYSALVSYVGEGQANITVTVDNYSVSDTVTVTCLSSTLYDEYESEISEFTTA